MVFPHTRRMSRIKFPIRDRLHEIELADGGKPIILIFLLFLGKRYENARSSLPALRSRSAAPSRPPWCTNRPRKKRGCRARHGASTKHTSSPPKKSPKNHKAICFLITIYFVAVDSGTLSLCETQEGSYRVRAPDGRTTPACWYFKIMASLFATFGCGSSGWFRPTEMLT